jgi:sugar/nucleoside kinase (ribokinase family)
VGEQTADRSSGKDNGAARRSTARQPLGSRTRPSRTPLASARPPQYLVVGHITADLQADGTVQLGGTALYSALTAARLGWRAAILTKGAFGIDFQGLTIPSLEEYAGQIDIIVQEADGPTIFVNEYQVDRRVQSIRHWAQPIDLRGLPSHWRNARIVHLGPVAQEIDQRQAAVMPAGFLGVTPQGWMREWPRRTGGRVSHGTLRIVPELLERIDSVIVSSDEIPYARAVVDQVASRRLGVVTFEERGSRIIHPEIGTPRGSVATRRQTVELPGFKVTVRDSTGAGDVFAAAFFTKAVEATSSAESAGMFANATAALSLREVGPHGIPDRDEVEALVAAAWD